MPHLGGFVVGAPAVQVRSTSCTQHAAPPLQGLVAIRAMSSDVFKAASRGIRTLPRGGRWASLDASFARCFAIF